MNLMVQNPMILYHSAELFVFYVVCFVFVFILKLLAKTSVIYSF